MSMEESISLEETNKIRISLGLKPLTEDAAPADDKDKQAEDNYAKQRETEFQNKEKKYGYYYTADAESVLMYFALFLGKYRIVLPSEYIWFI